MTFPFNRAQWFGLVTAAPIPAAYIGARWFPFQDVASDELVTHIKLARNPLAPYVSLDAEIPKVPEDVYKTIKASIAYIRYEKEFSEKDLRIFNEIGSGEASLVTQGQRERRRQIQNYAELLSQAVDSTIEKQRMDLIFSGTIDNSWEDDRKYELTITFPGVHSWDSTQLTSNKYWDQSSSDPITDLEKMIKTIQDASSVRPGVMIVSTDILLTLAKNANFIALWNASRGAGAEATALTRVQAANFVSEALDLEVVEYTAQYTKIAINKSTGEPYVRRYDMVDAKKMALLPNAPLGDTATSPDEENGWRPGRYTWGPLRSWRPPRVYVVGAGQNCMVRCNFPDQILHAQVLNAEV
jgi:hypothetical protein